MFLVIDIYLYCMFNSSLLVKETIHISHIYGSFYFFLVWIFAFLANSELITSPIAPLSNNTSTITPSYILIISSPIFIVSSLNMFPLFRLQLDILSTKHCYSCILFFSLSLQFPVFFNSVQNSQILYSYNSSSLCSHLWYKNIFSSPPLLSCTYKIFLTTTVFVLLTPSIKVDLTSACCISYLLSYIWGGGSLLYAKSTYPENISP